MNQLSLLVFERVLTSKALQLQLENEAYALLQSPHAQIDRQGLFYRLAPLLRYHHMTHDFLVNVVCKCWLMEESGLLIPVVRRAFVQRDFSPSILQRVQVQQGPTNRGVTLSEASWELNSSFPLEEVAALGPGGRVVKWCGLVAGYPVGLRLEREEDDDTLGAYVCTWAVEPDHAYIIGPAAGMMLEYDVQLSPNVKRSSGPTFFGDNKNNCVGWDDLFDEPWAEVVRDGSPHFPDGKMEVKATFKLAAKNGN